MEETTNGTGTTESGTAGTTTETELLEQILAELQAMNEDDPVDELETLTGFEELVVENQKLDNSISISNLVVVCCLTGVLLAKLLFRKM